MRRTTNLDQAALGALSLLKQVTMVVAGTLLIAIAAQISVPMFPVPMTLQTLAIMTIGLTFGARLGTITLVTYLAEGAMGLPVFASGNGGLAYMEGPTGGFLLGFVAMAWLTGFAADRGLARSALTAIPVTLAAAAMIYIPGLIWPAITLGTEWSSLWAGWMAPFLVGDAVKAVLAALAVSAGLSVFGRRA